MFTQKTGAFQITDFKIWPMRKPRHFWICSVWSILDGLDGRRSVEIIRNSDTRFLYLWETWVSNMLGFQSIISRCFQVDHLRRKDLFPRSKKLQWMVMSIAVRSGDGWLSGDHETYTVANVDYRIIRLPGQKKRNFLWCESQNMINTCYSVKENSQANAVNKSNLCSYRQPFSWNLGCYWGSTQRFPPRGAVSQQFFLSHGNVCFSVPRRVLFQQVSGHPAASITLRRMLAGYPLPDSWSLGVGWRDEYERCTMESMKSQNIQYIQS